MSSKLRLHKKLLNLEPLSPLYRERPCNTLVASIHELATVQQTATVLRDSPSSLYNAGRRLVGNLVSSRIEHPPLPPSCFEYFIWDVAVTVITPIVTPRVREHEFGAAIIVPNKNDAMAAIRHVRGRQRRYSSVWRASPLIIDVQAHAYTSLLRENCLALDRRPHALVTANPEMLRQGIYARWFGWRPSRRITVVRPCFLGRCAPSAKDSQCSDGPDSDSGVTREGPFELATAYKPVHSAWPIVFHKDLQIDCIRATLRRESRNRRTGKYCRGRETAF